MSVTQVVEAESLPTPAACWLAGAYGGASGGSVRSCATSGQTFAWNVVVPSGTTGVVSATFMLVGPNTLSDNAQTGGFRIDGGTVTSTTPVFGTGRNVVFTSPVLSDGTHLVELTRLTGNVPFDFYTVVSSDPPAPVQPVTNPDLLASLASNNDSVVLGFGLLLFFVTAAFFALVGR